MSIQPFVGRARVWRQGTFSLLIAAAMVFATVPRAVAQDAEEADPNVPLLVINVASVERLLDQAVTAFDAAGRPELSETLGGALERFNDLQGLNRSQSTGIMLFLSGLTPDSVAYVPVKNVDELVKTIEASAFPDGTRLLAKKTGDDSYEMTGGREKLYAKVQGDYAFVASSPEGVDRSFRDPVRLTSKLSKAYDLGVSLNLKSIAGPTRDLFMTLLRNNIENGLQRRDNEPETAHRFRRAAGMRNLEIIEQLVTQGEELTLGWALSGADKKGALELAVTATHDSEFAFYFNELKGTQSHFANLLKSGSPLTASISWRLDRSAKKMLREILSAVESDLTRNLSVKPTGSAEVATEGEAANPVEQLIQVLKATAEAGHVDAAFQYLGQPPGPFVLGGGVKVADDGTLAAALSEIAGRLKGKSALSSVRTNDFTHRGIAFHRIEFARLSEGRQRIYGEHPGLFFGAGEGVLWVALGGDDAVAELKRAIDEVAKPVPDTVATIPLQFVMNFSSWMDVFDPQNREEGIAALARRSFSKGGDALRIEALPIDDGVRIRVQFDEAFIRLLGQAVARRMDRAESEGAESEPAESDAE